MKLKIEEIDEKSKILLVFDRRYPIISRLKDTLQEYQCDIYSSTSLPLKLDYYNLIFIFDTSKAIERILDERVRKTRILILLFGKGKKLSTLSKMLENYNLANIKIVNLNPSDVSESTLEKILWFIFSASKENILNIERLVVKRRTQRRKIIHPIHFKLNKKKFFLTLTFLFLFIEFFFIIPLSLSLFYLYKSIDELTKYNITKSREYLSLSEPFSQISKSSYQISRPALSFFSLALIPDSLFALSDSGYSFSKEALNTVDNAKRIVHLVLNTEKSPEEHNEIITRFKKLPAQIKKLSVETDSLFKKINYKSKKIDEFKNKLSKTKETLQQAEKIVVQSEKIIGGDTEKKYLLLFQNNMEIRPGGGFIGSIGFATFSNYTLTDLVVSDVYEADGQLKEHIEPPEAIKKYLNQPNWFLRDSNFSPDFKENFEKALFFIDKELKNKDVEGGVAITTTAITYILESMGELYIPDYDEVVSSNNFYIKAQTNSEKDFFPGSTQKRNFLSSVLKILVLKLENANLLDFVSALKKSLEEKHIVLNFRDKTIQKDIVKLGWDGGLANTDCVIKADNCVADYLFSFDANLGVNKANFFVSRITKLKVQIDDKGDINNSLNILFQNDSDKESFPGGTYRNFFQIFLPLRSFVREVTSDGVLVENFEEKTTEKFRILTYYFELSPKKTINLQVKYRLAEKIVKGKNGYQLIIQKQIGALNNDLILEFKLPRNIHVLNQNFTAVAKGSALIYNSNLSNDRIFIMELVKE